MSARQQLWTLLVLILSSLIQPQTITHQFSFGNVSAGHEERALLLTAHPDDETFFFSPTLAALSRARTPPTHPVEGIGEIFVLCLSTGNAKGLGDVRKKEFGQALDVFGITEERRFIVDHPYLQDNKTAAWDPAAIANTLKPFIVEYDITTVCNVRWSISHRRFEFNSQILTFDSYGITGHPNHRSTLAGVEHLVANTFLRSSSNRRIRLFALSSRPGVTKHLGPLVMLSSQRHESLKGPVFTSSLLDYVTALRAMSKHTSQLRMFPWFKGLFSRYLWVNEWVEVTV
ncbi:putative deacetylase LmbE-like domain-containing protein [Mycena rosella]|uniref:N-acetylglucosaminylphosphatidylinositol deacetylase n=1 Tax=Mycena rosella TaxID=1033263 RepID=A0AAD7FXV2_MYCRO|nr:putative deacetylase LmbE-like domain-containing protein [Mycena rosella]